MQLNPDFTTEQREALVEMVQALRQTLEHSATLNADPDTLRALAAQARALNDAMAPHTGNKVMEHFNAQPGEDLNALLPYSPVTGRFHAMAAPVELRREGELLIGDVTLGKIYEGPPGCVHGAWVAAIYDQILAFAGMINGTGGPTANLKVDFLKPTPLLKPLRFETRIDNIEDRKVFVSGQCVSDGVVVSKCTGLFILYQPR